MRNASILFLAFAGFTMASGCASTQNSKPAVCDGKHRRPANPYGTVLPTVPLPTVSAAAPSTPTSAPTTPTAPAAPPAGDAPAKSPGPMSALDPKSFDPCGRPA